MSVWADVVGQPEVVAELDRAVREPAAMTHSWLFTGPPGSGRSVAARAFAAALQCPQGGCGHCQACHTALAGTHADVTVVVPEGLSLHVADMRELVRTAFRRPSVGSWQIVLIEDADRLTERAANALLKAVEEPPPRGVFLLCAPSLHPDDVPITIRSRCRAVGLTTPATEQVAEVLVRRDGIEPAMASWAAGAAQGHVGRARHLARDESARLTRTAVLEIPASLTSLGACLTAADELIISAENEAKTRAQQRDSAETEEWQAAFGAGATGPGTRTSVSRAGSGALRDLEKRQKSRATRFNRDALDRALVDLAGCYRDVLVVRSGAEAGSFAHPDRQRETAELAVTLDPDDALVRLEAVLACREALELNVKPRVALEAMTAALILPRAG